MGGIFRANETATIYMPYPTAQVPDGGDPTIVRLVYVTDWTKIHIDIYDGSSTSIAGNTLAVIATLPGVTVTNLTSSLGFSIAMAPSVLVGYQSGLWFCTGGAIPGLVVNSDTYDYPRGEVQWGGSYNTLCTETETTASATVGLNIAPFPVPFLSTEKPSITYYAGQSPGGDVLVTITDPTGAPVVTAENMTQVGGTDRWDYVLNAAFAVTGLYKVQCLINGDTSSYRTSSFVWASATDPSFGSYQALATKTTATQTLAQALYAKEFNRLYVDTNTNTMTLYDVDNTTPLFVWALLPSATNILDRVPD